MNKPINGILGGVCLALGFYKNWINRLAKIRLKSADWHLSEDAMLQLRKRLDQLSPEQLARVQETVKEHLVKR